MAFDDDGTWNTVAVYNGAGIITANLSDILAALNTGSTTQVRATYQGQYVDWGQLRFLIR